MALDLKSGKLKWYFQQIPHDVWDLDTASPAVLVDAKDSTGKLAAVAQAGKTGWVYVLDRGAREHSGAGHPEQHRHARAP